MTASSRDPWEDILNQMKELTRLVREGQKTSEPLPKDIEEQLEYLELQTEIFCKLNEEAIKNLNISENTVQDALKSTENLTGKEKRLFEKSKDLKKEIDSIKQDIAVDVSMAKQREKIIGKKGKESVTRQKKFRRVGGKKNWKPI